MKKISVEKVRGIKKNYTFATLNMKKDRNYGGNHL